MYLNFHEKLDFLMNLTGTSNSALAKQTSLDPSFISRLRSGSRRPSRSENYISKMAVVLTKRCREEYQLQGLIAKLQSEDIVCSRESMNLEAAVEKWLKESPPRQKTKVGSFIRELDEFSFKKASPLPEGLDENYSEPTKQDVYHGVDGKRSAVIRFLNEIINSDKKYTLYLYSDEDLTWLMDDPLFTQQWSRVFLKVLQKGNKVKIVHTITRSLDEMFTAIKEWIPFYLTGNIEPYYYPRTRDANFRRTIFIAPGLCAVSSNTIGRNSENNLNFYLTDKDTLNSLFGEFEDFLKLCRPLMKIFNTSSNTSLLDTVAEFEGEKGNCILKSKSVSSITIPLFALEKFLKNHSKEDRDTLFRFHRNRQRAMVELLEGHSFLEVIQLPDVSQLHERKIPIGFTVFSGTPVYYDPYTFKSQLENMVSLMKHYPNYNVRIQDNYRGELTIYAKENIGLLIMKYTQPSISFAINEPYMTQAFWDYLRIDSPDLSNTASYKGQTIEMINEYIRKLKDS
jgi:hypothetical protein